MNAGWVYMGRGNREQRGAQLKSWGKSAMLEDLPVRQLLDYLRVLPSACSGFVRHVIAIDLEG
jgi:hypothetical protein